MISRTTDYRRVKRITDANPMESDNPWRLTISRQIFYLMETDNGRDVGVWALEPYEDEYGPGYQIHTAMGPDCRGRKAISSAKRAIGWCFEHTSAETVYAVISVHFKHVHVIARATGLEPIGIHKNMRCYIMRRDNFDRKVA